MRETIPASSFRAGMIMLTPGSGASHPRSADRSQDGETGGVGAADYSRNASAGSILSARRAGVQAAATLTSASTLDVNAKLRGSLALSPATRNLASGRVNKAAIASPRQIPLPASIAASART